LDTTLRFEKVLTEGKNLGERSATSEPLNPVLDDGESFSSKAQRPRMNEMSESNFLTLV